jgi:DNA-binding MarR family transcriptional regulator
MSSIMRDTVDNVNQIGPAGDRDVLELVHAVMHLFRSQQFQALRDGPHGVTHMDSKVMGFFARHPGSTQSALAQHSGRDKAQVARLVAGLRERGLLAAEADEGDRRNVRLSLTAEGLAVQRSLQQQARRLSARAVAGFDAGEKARLQALLQRVKENLDLPDGPATGS